MSKWIADIEIDVMTLVRIAAGLVLIGGLWVIR